MDGQTNLCRRYAGGETTNGWALKGMIFHKCPTYGHATPPCQASYPSGDVKMDLGE